MDIERAIPHALGLVRADACIQTESHGKTGAS